MSVVVAKGSPCPSRVAGVVVSAIRDQPCRCLAAAVPTRRPKPCMDDNSLWSHVAWSGVARDGAEARRFMDACGFPRQSRVRSRMKWQGMTIGWNHPRDGRFAQVASPRGLPVKADRPHHPRKPGYTATRGQATRGIRVVGPWCVVGGHGPQNVMNPLTHTLLAYAGARRVPREGCSVDVLEVKAINSC